MLEYIVVGSALAFTASIQPGPLQAYYLSRVAVVGWRRTLPAAFAPLLSDGPIAFVALLLIGQLTTPIQAGLRVAGGMLLFYLAWRTYRQWKRAESAAVTTEGKVPRSLFEATLVNILNPNPYLGWALILGPIVVDAWRRLPAYGITVVAAFYLVMISMNALLIFAFGTTRFLTPELRKTLLLVSALLLLGLGVYQWVLGVASIT